MRVTGVRSSITWGRPTSTTTREHYMSPTQPTKRFKLGAIQLNVWSNNDRSGKPFHLATFSKLHRDPRGRWSETQSFRHSDLPVLRTLAERALAWMGTTHEATMSEASRQESESGARLLHLLAALERQLGR
jgi:hypothetical protein